MTVTCSSDEVYINSYYNVSSTQTLSSGNNWTATFNAFVSKCCGSSLDGTHDKSGTVTCTAKSSSFTATGRANINIRAHSAGDCEWLF